MPTWAMQLLLAVVLPGITTVATEYAKRLAKLVVDRLPRSAVAVLASAMVEALNQLQAGATGVTLPPGVLPIITILINEFVNDVNKGPKPISVI